MSIEKVERRSGAVWRVRWRDEQGSERSRVIGRKRDAEAFDAEVRRQKRMGELAMAESGRETLDKYVTGSWAAAHAAHLSARTRQSYASCYDKHISPRLGGCALRDIDPDALAKFQADLIRDEVGPHAIRKAMTLLGGILQRAAESKRIPNNPQRVVRKAPLPQSDETRPLAPATVEALRQVLSQRDATIVSVLAYAGLRPGELRGLRWRHVREQTIIVNAEKTRKRRTVRLLAPLAADLAMWKGASGDPDDDAHVFPDSEESEWSANGFEKWRSRVFVPACEAAEIADARPYDLRHSFASLLLHEGRSVIYVARQLGHGAEMTLRTYGHVIDELEDSPNLPAEDAIRAARKDEDTEEPERQVRVRSVSAPRRRCRNKIGEACKVDSGSRVAEMPRAGFEPAAYSLGGSRSIQLSYRGLCREKALLSRFRRLSVACGRL
jgi:integrase